MFITPEEFPNEYINTSYPFVYQPSFETREKFNIPFYLFKDANIYSTYDEPLNLTQIKIEAEYVILYFSTSNTKNTITCSLAITTQEDSFAVLYENETKCCGIIEYTKKGINEISTWPINTYIVPFGNMVISPKCYHTIIPNGITSICVDDNVYAINPSLLFATGLVAEPYYAHIEHIIPGDTKEEKRLTVTIHAVGEPLTENISEELADINYTKCINVTQGEDKLKLTSAYVALLAYNKQNNSNALNITGKGDTLTISLTGAK